MKHTNKWVIVNESFNSLTYCMEITEITSSLHLSTERKTNMV